VKPKNTTCCIVVLKKGESSVLWQFSTVLRIAVNKHSPHWTARGFAKRSIPYIFYEVVNARSHWDVLAGIVAYSFSNAPVVKSEKGKKLNGTM
jgi:hypothetical protein